MDANINGGGTMKHQRILLRAAAVVALGLAGLATPRRSEAAPLDNCFACVTATSCDAVNQHTACVNACGTSKVCSCGLPVNCMPGQVEVICGLC
jgi:hypothetical protein